MDTSETTKEAFHGLGCVEENINSILYVLGYNTLQYSIAFSEIKERFKQIAYMVHPDRNPSDTGSTEKVLQLLIGL